MPARSSVAIYKVGDKIIVQPSGHGSRITHIESNGQQLSEAFAPQSVVIQLEDDIDISRGDVIVNGDTLPNIEHEFEALVCWMDGKPLIAGNRYLLQHNSRIVKAIVKEIKYKLDVNSLEQKAHPAQAELNDVIRVRLRTASPLRMTVIPNQE